MNNEKEEITEIPKIEKIALIDADSLIYYCSLGNKENPPTLEGAMEDVDNRITTMVSNAGCSHYILFLSNTRNNFRKKLAYSKVYKGNRPNNVMPPVFVGLKAYLRTKPSCECSDFEADDAVALFQNFINYETVICSPDKDVLQQLPGIHYNYSKEIVINTSEEDAFNFLCKQLLMGDTTDNITGIPKVGDKTSDKLLEKYKEENSTREEILCSIHALYMEKFGIIEGCNRFSECLRLVYLLRNNDDLKREVRYEIDNHEVDRILTNYLLSSSNEW